MLVQEGLSHCIIFIDSKVAYDYRLTISLKNFLRDKRLQEFNIKAIMLGRHKPMLEHFGSDQISNEGVLDEEADLIGSFPIDHKKPEARAILLKECFLQVLSRLGATRGVKLGIYVCFRENLVDEFFPEILTWVLFLVGYDIVFVKRLVFNQSGILEVAAPLRIDDPFERRVNRFLLIMAIAYLYKFGSGLEYSIAKSIEEALEGRYGSADVLRKKLRVILERACLLSLIDVYFFHGGPHRRAYKLSRFGEEIARILLDESILSHVDNEGARIFVKRVVNELGAEKP